MKFAIFSLSSTCFPLISLLQYDICFPLFDILVSISNKFSKNHSIELGKGFLNMVAYHN